MKPLDIIKETIDTYKHPENRSVDPVTGKCLYNDPNGNHCAYARIIKPEYRDLLIEDNHLSDQPKLEEVLNPYVEGYEDHSYNLYIFIQRIHDVFFNPTSLQELRLSPDPKSKISTWVYMNIPSELMSVLATEVRNEISSYLYNAVFQTN